MRTFALLGAKKLGWCVRTDKGLLSQCGHFEDKRGGGQFFAILCGRLL